MPTNGRVPYSIESHASIGAQAGAFVQTQFDRQTVCAKVLAVKPLPHDPAVVIAQLRLIGPLHGVAWKAFKGVLHCGGIDTHCQCFAASLGPSGALGRGPARGEVPEGGSRACSNTARNVHL